MEQRTAEKPATEKTAETKLSFGMLSSSGFTILGVLYLMGYIIVNGYQAKYLSYSANAIQLKHVAAGLLYSVLTFLQTSVVATVLVSEWSDRQQRQAHNTPTGVKPGQIESSPASQAERGVLQKRFSAFKRTWSALGEKTRWFGHILNGMRVVMIAYVPLFLFIGYLGNSALPDRYDEMLIVKTCWVWIVTNLLMAALITFTITSIAKRRSKAVEEFYRTRQSPLPGSEPKDEITSAPETSKLKTLFAEAVAGKWLATPLLAGVLLFFSLTSFQGLYGRLRPDYGGGALYRVALYLSAATGLPNATAGVPDEIRRKVESKDSWLLLVDKDSSFIYLVSVDKDGNRSLMQIALSEIKGLEVLSARPVHPEDAAFFIQQEQKNKASD